MAGSLSSKYRHLSASDISPSGQLGGECYRARTQGGYDAAWRRAWLTEAEQNALTELFLAGRSGLTGGYSSRAPGWWPLGSPAHSSDGPVRAPESHDPEAS